MMSTTEPTHDTQTPLTKHAPVSASSTGGLAHEEAVPQAEQHPLVEQCNENTAAPEGRWGDVGLEYRHGPHR
jgi:hypothetical protein